MTNFSLFLTFCSYFFHNLRVIRIVSTAMVPRIVVLHGAHEHTP